MGTELGPVETNLILRSSCLNPTDLLCWVRYVFGMHDVIFSSLERGLGRKRKMRRINKIILGSKFFYEFLLGGNIEYTCVIVVIIFL